jgi:HAE1 family hydrophobic/amphiphilic exporter-1
MLIGLVAKNAILIVDFANHLKAEGKNSVEALILSGKTRLRPATAVN